MTNQDQTNQYEDIPFHDTSFINVSYLNSPTGFASHWHTYGEFILCLSPEETVFTISSETYVLKQNDLLTVWPCELHSIESAPKGSVLIIQFPGQMLSCTSELHMLHDFITHRHLLSSKEAPQQAEQAARLLFRIKELSASSEPFRDTRKQICLMELLLLLGQGFSKYHFSRLFKEYMNTSFTAYLTSQRIQKAISLFKQHMDCTPSEYRSRMIQNVPENFS